MENLAIKQTIITGKNPYFNLSSLINSEFIAFALVDFSGSILQMNAPFSKISKIQSKSSKNLLNHSLFNQTAFIDAIQSLKDKKQSEFSICQQVDNSDSNPMFIKISGIKLETADGNESILIKLEEASSETAIQDIIKQIGANLSKADNNNFFESICQNLYESLDIEMVFIGEYKELEPSLQSICFIKNGKFVSDTNLPIKDSPIEKVINEKVSCFFQNNVQLAFPDDQNLKIWNVESYIGFPLKDYKGNIVGYISIMNSRVLKKPELINSILSLYSYSLGSELERKRQERRIVSGEKRHKIIFEQCPFGIATSRPDNKLLPNPRFCEMLGYTLDELVQLTKYDITHPEDHKSHLNGIRNKQGSYQFNKRYIKKDGSICHCRVTAPKIDGDLEDLSNIFVIIEDISCQIESKEKIKKHQEQLKKNLEQLNEKNRQLQKYIDSNLQLENFAHIASHDLREPLRSIGNFSQILNAQLVDRMDETEKEFFGFIMSGVKNMNQLIEDLLLYSTINTQDTPQKELDLNNILFMVNRNLDKAIFDNKVQLLVHELPFSFIASSTKMKQLFQNLIANAIKFKKPDVDPIIEIQCRDKGDFWEFSVSDNGIGINENYKEKIFLIFKKLHSKSEYQGTGIGLAVCKKIVSQHGGDIWIESEIGKGATFFFTLRKS